MAEKSSHTAAEIKVLEGLEGVRKRFDVVGLSKKIKKKGDLLILSKELKIRPRILSELKKINKNYKTLYSEIHVIQNRRKK